MRKRSLFSRCRTYNVNCIRRSFSVSYHHVFYCTNIVIKLINALYWGITLNCVQFSSYMLGPLMDNQQGDYQLQGEVTKIHCCIS